MASEFNDLDALLSAEDIFRRITLSAPQICQGPRECRIILLMILLDSNGKPYRRTIVFDVETTGLYPEAGDWVIEVGAVALDGETVLDEFHSLINVDRPIDPEAQRVHGITKEMLAG
jgi:hypothetical protein